MALLKVQLQTCLSPGVPLIVTFTASGSLAYTVLKVIYSFVEMVFVFSFLFVVQEQFLKGEMTSIFINISLCKTPKYRCY